MTPFRFYAIVLGADWDHCRFCEADIAPLSPAVQRNDGTVFCTLDCGKNASELTAKVLARRPRRLRAGESAQRIVGSIHP